MIDADIMEAAEICKNEKGFNAAEISRKEWLVNTINLLLCHTEQSDIINTAVGLKLVIERLDLEDVCHIWIDQNANNKLRLFFTGAKTEE